MPVIGEKRNSVALLRKSGRVPPEQVAGIVRNEWPTSPEYAK